MKRNIEYVFDRYIIASSTEVLTVEGHIYRPSVLPIIRYRFSDDTSYESFYWSNGTDRTDYSSTLVTDYGNIVFTQDRKGSFTIYNNSSKDIFIHYINVGINDYTIVVNKAINITLNNIGDSCSVTIDKAYPTIGSKFWISYSPNFGFDGDHAVEFVYGTPLHKDDIVGVVDYDGANTITMAVTRESTMYGQYVVSPPITWQTLSWVLPEGYNQVYAFASDKSAMPIDKDTLPLTNILKATSDDMLFDGSISYYTKGAEHTGVFHSGDFGTAVNFELFNIMLKSVRLVQHSLYEYKFTDGTNVYPTYTASAGAYVFGYRYFIPESASNGPYKIQAILVTDAYTRFIDYDALPV